MDLCPTATGLYVGVGSSCPPPPEPPGSTLTHDQVITIICATAPLVGLCILALAFST